MCFPDLTLKKSEEKEGSHNDLLLRIPSHTKLRKSFSLHDSLFPTNFNSSSHILEKDSIPKIEEFPSIPKISKSVYRESLRLIQNLNPRAEKLFSFKRKRLTMESSPYKHDFSLQLIDRKSNIECKTRIKSKSQSKALFNESMETQILKKIMKSKFHK